MKPPTDELRLLFLGACIVWAVFGCSPNTLFLAGTMCEAFKWAFFPWSISYICFGQGRRKGKSNHLTTPLTLPWQVFHRSEKPRCCLPLGHVKHFPLVALPLFSIQPRISSAVNTDGARLTVVKTIPTLSKPLWMRFSRLPLKSLGQPQIFWEKHLLGLTQSHQL